MLYQFEPREKRRQVTALSVEIQTLARHQAVQCIPETTLSD